MKNEDTLLNTAVKAEWDTLRAEIAARDAQNFQIMTGSITVYAALLALFITFAKDTGVQVTSGPRPLILLPVVLYFIPFTIILPSLYLIINNVHATRRIAEYIKVYLESKSTLQWERSLERFYKEIENRYKSRSPWDRWGGTAPFEEAKVMFALFLGLGVFDGVVFFLLGDWSFLPSKPTTQYLTQYLILASPFIFFIDASRRVFSRHSLQIHYREIWEKVHFQQQDHTKS